MHSFQINLISTKGSLRGPEPTMGLSKRPSGPQDDLKLY